MPFKRKVRDLKGERDRNLSDIDLGRDVLSTTRKDTTHRRNSSKCKISAVWITLLS